MNRLKLILFLAIIAGLGSKITQAQTDSTYRFSLIQAQEFAIDHFFVSKNAALDIEIAKKKILETTAIGLPQVSGSVGYQYIPGDIPSIDFMGAMIPFFDMSFQSFDVTGIDYPQSMRDAMTTPNPSPIAPKSTLTYGLTVSQLIFSGEYIVGLQATKVYKNLSLESYNNTKIEIREGVAGTYYALLILEKNKKVLKETLRNLEMMFEHTKKYLEQGLLEDNDADQLEITLKRTQNSLRMIENQSEYLGKMFKYQLGLQAETQVELMDSINLLVETNIIIPTAYQFNLDDNITYQMLTTQEALQKLSLKREKSTFLPSVAGFYQYNEKSEKAALDFTINHILGVNVSIPIVSSGMRMSKVGQAKIQLDKARNMKDQESQRLILKSEQSLFDYNTALQNYYNERDNFELSERVFQKATVRFREGLVSSLDVSTINNQYLQAQLSYATAIQSLLTSKTALDKAFNKL